MGSVPLQRSKAWLEEKGWHVWVTEHWNQWAHIRQDMFGLIDFVAIRHDSPGVWGINSCGEDVQAHIRKYIDGWTDVKKGKVYGPNTHLPVWLAAGNKFSIFGWSKKNSGGQGSRKTWQLRVVEFYIEGCQVKTREIPMIELESKGE